MCCLEVITFCLFFITLKLRKTRDCLSPRQFIFLISYVFSISAVCENDPDIDAACVRCGKRKHAFWDDPVGDLLSYLCKPWQWCKRVIAIAHNAKGFDAHFILHRAIFLKWTPKLILNGQKIVCMAMEHLTFLDSISFLPMALPKLSEAFGLVASKSWYPHFFNTLANRDYVGPIPGIEQYGADHMSVSERKDFMAWYNMQKNKVFDNRQVLLHVDVFLESCTIASACNKVFRKRFL